MAEINNGIYETLGERWYEASDDPVALLRAENNLLGPWVKERIRNNFIDTPMNVLDIGCGAGFLSNQLSEDGHRVTGLDQSPESLKVARNHDHTCRVKYERGDALSLPYEAQSFDVVTCMDFLEHVTAPSKVIAEAGRVLRPGGLFFFHTFNRNVLSWFLVIKGVEWLVKNTPKNMHVIELFLKPAEVRKYCEEAGLEIVEMKGLSPDFANIPLKSLFTGVVPPDMSFRFTKSQLLSYAGYARKTL